jgi:hypothetical protein
MNTETIVPALAPLYGILIRLLVETVALIIIIPGLHDLHPAQKG